MNNSDVLRALTEGSSSSSAHPARSAPCTVGLKKKRALLNQHEIYIAPSCSSNLANFMDPSPAARFSIAGLNQWISGGCLGWNAPTSQIYHQIAIPTLISWFTGSVQHTEAVCCKENVTLDVLLQLKRPFRPYTNVEKKSNNSCELSVLLSRVTLSLFWRGSAACSANECACADVLHH